MKQGMGTFLYNEIFHPILHEGDGIMFKAHPWGWLMNEQNI